MFTLRTILHPTDFSQSADQALLLASSLARDHGAGLIILHVAIPPMSAYGGVMTPPPPPQDYRRLAEEQLHQVQVPGTPIEVERRLEVGLPAEVILRVAQEVHCDLIVMGTHGRTGLGRLLMGSVAEQVLRQARCPVLTVKCPPTQAQPSPAPAEGAGKDLKESLLRGFAIPQA